MLKYFNENISLVLQERYRDLHEYRKTEVEEGSPREAKLPKIAEEVEAGGGEGGFDHTSTIPPPPFPRALDQIKEEDNFVTSWLQNSFKMTAADSNPEASSGGSALDLRAAPLSLQIPALQQAVEAQRQFKMSQDFWNRSRPVTPAQEPVSEPVTQPGPTPPTPQPPATPDHKILAENLVNDIQQQQQSPSADSTLSERSMAPFALPPQQSPPGDGTLDRSAMMPFALQQQARQGQSISERTLEECWSTLQRIFMHKNAMQMHARELQRGLGGEVKPHQCQQCLKSFSSNHQLVQHIRVHTGEKPYKCSYCDRRFKQLSHVQQHTRLHTGERPYKCHLPECGRAFIQLSNLQQHLRNHDAQVERAKNRPFHCSICGKGFATESSLRTHTAKEVQLHLGVLQQHAALMIGGAAATPCPICHKICIGGEALVEHMKNTHKDPNASGVASPPATSPYPAQAKPASIDPYLAKRRTANHPCPVCGKHYVNEGSLRKHLACHPETQLTSGLRMWPCSVCQAVFTHESGLLTHMEHMRMEPKHQFAAQYVLSRAAAERRERDIIAAAVSAGGSGILNLAPSSPAHSDSSSNGRLSSSAGSEAGATVNKLSELLRANNNHQYGDERVAALAAAAANMMAQPGDGASAVQVAAANLVSAMRQQLAREPSAQQPPETLPPNEAALRIQQAEALLRSQAEALRLAVSQAAAAAHNNDGASPLRHNGVFPPQPPNDGGGQLSPELVEAFRLAQEQRLEQALRLHDPRMLGFNLPSPVQQAAQQVAQQAVAAQQAAAAQQAQQVAQQAAQHVAQQAAQHVAQQAAQHVAQQAAQHVAHQAAQHVAQQAAQHVAQQAAQHVAQQAAQHVAQQAAQHVAQHAAQHVAQHAAQHVSQHAVQHVAQHTAQQQQLQQQQAVHLQQNTQP